MSPSAHLVRHLLATLAYRTAKVLRDCPPGFATFSNETSRRAPVQILAHMGDLIEWGQRLVETGEFVWRPGGGDDWETEVRRFFDCLASLDRAIAAVDLPAERAEKLVQAPLADALTHVGQLAMLRGAAGAPVRPESYARATIVAGRVGLDQAPPGREFDGDASARAT